MRNTPVRIDSCWQIATLVGSICVMATCVISGRTHWALLWAILASLIYALAISYRVINCTKWWGRISGRIGGRIGGRIEDELDTE